MSKNSNRTNSKRNSKNSGTRSSLQNLLLLPVILSIALVPLIVRMQAFNSNLNQFDWFGAADPQTDFFLLSKAYVFLFLCIVVLGILAWNAYQLKTKKKSAEILKEDGHYKFTPLLAPLGVYGVLALLSTIFSKYSYFGYHGIMEQFESVFVLLGYVLIAYYAFLVVKTKQDVDTIAKWLLVSVLFLCGLGLLQAIGHDFFATTLGKKIIVPSKYWQFIGGMSFTFEKNRVFLTMYNPNYVGLYTSLMSPILLILFFFTKEKRLKIAYAVAIFGMLLCIVGSNSRNAFVAILVSLLFVLILFRNYLIHKWKIVLASTGLLIVLFVGMNAFMGNAFLNRILTIFDTTVSAPHALTDVQTNKDNVTIVYNNNSLIVKTSPADNSLLDIKLYDETNTEIPTTIDANDGQYVISDPRFSTIRIQQSLLGDVRCFGLNIDGTNWIFSNETGDGTYYYYNPYWKFEKIVAAESALFTNNEQMGSGRGYIWSRTIPLLKDSLILGTGADTFTIAFPQNDYVGRFHNGYLESLISKPHNLFLQIAVQTGVPSLIAILLFYAMYFVQSIKLYIKNEYAGYASQTGVAIFLGSIGYMTSSLFNDSTVTVAPAFWALIGVGLAMNHQVKKERNTKSI